MILYNKKVIVFYIDEFEGLLLDGSLVYLIF